jgi:hypothetical protein
MAWASALARWPWLEYALAACPAADDGDGWAACVASDCEVDSVVCFIALDKWGQYTVQRLVGTHGASDRPAGFHKIILPEMGHLARISRAPDGHRMRHDCASCITKYGVTTFIGRQRHGDCDPKTGHL